MGILPDLLIDILKKIQDQLEWPFHQDSYKHGATNCSRVCGGSCTGGCATSCLGGCGHPTPCGGSCFK